MDMTRLIAEIHRRSLWQVLAIYLGASWLVLQVAQHVVMQFRLPEWTYGAALLLLLLGLPVVLATAFVQEGPPGTDGAASPEAPAGPTRAGAATAAAAGGASARTMFTWRNALMGAVGAAALWGVVAAGWLLVAPSRGEEAGLPRGPRAQITSLEDRASPEEAEDAEAPEEGDTLPRERAAEDAGAGMGADPRRTPSRFAEGGEAPPAGGEPPAERGAARAPARPDRAVERAQAARERREYAALLEAAARAGEEARATGAMERGLDLGAADSLLARAPAVAAAGDLRRAQRDLASARALYDDAARRAAAEWRRAADSAASALEALRARARPSADGYEEAERHRVEGSAAAGAGDFRAAVTHFREAEADYARAVRAAEEAAVAEEEAGPEEPAEEARPDEAEAREAVTSAVARLERALETEDLDALRAVWVTMDGESARSFEAFFDRIRDFDVEIRVQWETLAASPSRVAVTGLTTWRYYDEGRREPASRPPFEQRFELALRDGEWVVVRY